MVEANTEQEAKEQVKQMFLEQANVPNTPVLDWTTESFAVAKQDGQLDCYAEEAEEV